MHYPIAKRYATAHVICRKRVGEIEAGCGADLNNIFPTNWQSFEHFYEACLIFVS